MRSYKNLKERKVFSTTNLISKFYARGSLINFKSLLQRPLKPSTSFLHILDLNDFFINWRFRWLSRGFDSSFNFRFWMCSTWTLMARILFIKSSIFGTKLNIKWAIKLVALNSYKRANGEFQFRRVRLMKDFSVWDPTKESSCSIFLANSVKFFCWKIFFGSVFSWHGRWRFLLTLRKKISSMWNHWRYKFPAKR